jgi:hypothetical protein
MNRSGMIKRGVAAAAISALAVAGIPALAGTAHAAVDSVTVAALGAYDTTEFADATPDMVVTVKDGVTLVNGQAVEFSYVFTPEGGVAQPATAYAPGGSTDASGTVDLNFNPVAAGSYTVNVRTVGSHISAPAFTFVAGQAAITWTDGASASSPQNGSDTYSGTVALTNAAATPLPGRTVSITYNNGAGNAIMSTPQPAGTVRVNDSAATATTVANGGFSVGLTDPAVPATPETGTLTADTTFTGATQLDVEFEVVPPVTHIAVTRANVFPGAAAPGKGVEFNVVVRGQAVPDATPENDPILKDYPVKFAVNNGFLTNDTQGAGLNVDPTDLMLTPEQDDLGDLFGFYNDLGADETVDTSDNAATNAAGVVATIGKNAGFNDDGLVSQTVTVTAGTKTATETVNYDVKNYLNIPAVAFRKDGGSTTVPGSVDLKFYAADQYGNLVGDLPASISDDSAIARVTPESPTTTDFIPSNPAATASSTQPTTQKVTGTVQANKNLVDANGNPAAQTTGPVSGDITLVWTKPSAGKTAIVAKLSGQHNGADADKLTVTTTKKANGAVVKLFKVVNGKLKPAGTKTLKNGKASFTKADKNGAAKTTYVAKVSSTVDTKGDRSNPRSVR